MFNASNFEAQKSEVAFFTEKAFQVSFVYFAGLAAFFALSKSDVMTAVVHATNLPLGGLIAVVVLLLNLVYITLACACLFAILKRGLFILKYTTSSPGSQPSVHREWEVFVRDDECMGEIKMRSIAWNIDNYYMIPLFFAIVAVSLVAAIMAATCNSTILQIAAAALVILHVIPGFILRQLSVLDHQCRQLL
ncbi:hypothetical protein [Kitasatospora sp. NPDC058218]|uniref:hypothetical protein n=1 Tax=Kitasatospora sp. NPDC058218 TaxID=3346385 RepID=UPI0036D8147C